MKPLIGYLILAFGISTGIASNSFAKVSDGFTDVTVLKALSKLQDLMEQKYSSHVVRTYSLTNIVTNLNKPLGDGSKENYNLPKNSIAVSQLLSLLNNSNLFFLPFLIGKNPSKINLSEEIPEFTRAGTKAVAPGRQSISILFFIASLIIKNPGSDIDGVPASDIKDIIFPDKTSSMYCFTTLCSLKE